MYISLNISLPSSAKHEITVLYILVTQTIIMFSFRIEHKEAKFHGILWDKFTEKKPADFVRNVRKFRWKTIGKKRTLSWEVYGQISLEGDLLCTD